MQLKIKLIYGMFMPMKLV